MNSPAADGARDAVLFITVYNRQSWGLKLLSRTSQHVLLASQTLGDLYEAIPCTSRELPCEHLHDDGSITISAFKKSGARDATADNVGAVVCVEGVLYADRQSGEDYAECVCNSFVFVVMNGH